MVSCQQKSLTIFFTGEERRAKKGKSKKGRSLGPLIAGQALAEIDIIDFIESIHARSEISSIGGAITDTVN